MPRASFVCAYSKPPPSSGLPSSPPCRRPTAPPTSKMGVRCDQPFPEGQKIFRPSVPVQLHAPGPSLPDHIRGRFSPSPWSPSLWCLEPSPRACRRVSKGRTLSKMALGRPARFRVSFENDIPDDPYVRSTSSTGELLSILKGFQPMEGGYKSEQLPGSSRMSFPSETGCGLKPRRP